MQEQNEVTVTEADHSDSEVLEELGDGRESLYQGGLSRLCRGEKKN
jgi:hypothetical protein